LQEALPLLVALLLLLLLLLYVFFDHCVHPGICVSGGCG